VVVVIWTNTKTGEAGICRNEVLTYPAALDLVETLLELAWPAGYSYRIEPVALPWDGDRTCA
jgi:hypothetical protein